MDVLSYRSLISHPSSLCLCLSYCQQVLDLWEMWHYQPQGARITSTFLCFWLLCNTMWHDIRAVFRCLGRVHCLSSVCFIYLRHSWSLRCSRMFYGAEIVWETDFGLIIQNSSISLHYKVNLKCLSSLLPLANVLCFWDHRQHTFLTLVVQKLKKRYCSDPSCSLHWAFVAQSTCSVASDRCLHWN